MFFNTFRIFFKLRQYLQSYKMKKKLLQIFATLSNLKIVNYFDLIDWRFTFITTNKWNNTGLHINSAHYPVYFPLLQKSRLNITDLEMMDSNLCPVEIMHKNSFRTLRLSKAQLWTAAFGPHQTLQSKYSLNIWYYTVC